jgi:hypothetical protein
VKRPLALAVLVMAGTAAVFSPRAVAKMPDLEVYWRSGLRAAAAEPLYPASDEHYQLKYLPAFGVLAIPLARLPLPAAKAAWFIASAALLPVLLALSLALLPSRRKPSWVLVALTVVAMAKFYGHELILGQVNLLFTVVALAAVHCEIGGRRVLAGLLIALAIVIKPYAVIFVPWLLARGSTGGLIGAGFGTLAALAVPAVAYGASGAVSLHHDWWHTVTTSTAPNLLNADNVSLAGMYAKWLGPGRVAAVLTLATAMAVLATAALVVLRRGVRSSAGLEAALLLTLIPLLSPQGWDYVFLLSTPAVMILVNHEQDLPAPLRVAALVALGTIAFSLYDVMGREAYAAFMALSVITVCYLVVVGALAALRARRIA